jgi:hypothetical protein
VKVLNIGSLKNYKILLPEYSRLKIFEEKMGALTPKTKY